MDGLWKEKIGGWNSKDSKRKSQTRNNTLRDKGRALLNVYNGHKTQKEDTNIFREESVVEWTSNKVRTFKEFKIEIWKVATPGSVRRVLICAEGVNHWTTVDGKDKIRTAYKYNNTWYDYFDDSEINQVTPLAKIDEEGINWDEELPRYVPERESKKYHYWSRHYSGDGDFLYNKPLPYWKRSTFYNDGKRRKIGQKIANSIDRSNIRKYITDGDWNKEIKTGAYSKSIAWLVH